MMSDVQQVESEQARKRDRARKQPDEAGQLIKYDAEAIARGKELVAKLKAQDQAVHLTEMELGELADRLQPKYRDKTLARFAKAIDIDADRLNRCRSVYRAYKDKEIKGSSPKFAVLQALQGHPKREEILAEKPKLTVREARGIMRTYRLAQGLNQDQEQAQEQGQQEQQKQQKQEQGQDPNWAVNEMRRALDEVMDFARKAWSKYGNLTKEHIDEAVLRRAMDDVEVFLGTVRQGARAFSDYADVVESILKRPMFNDKAAPDAP